MNNIKSLLKDGLIISQDQTINEAKQAIKILLSKIAKFESLNSELIEALEFYANEQNWKNVGTYDGPVSCVIVESDQYAIGSQDYGGKLARSILKELRGDK